MDERLRCDEADEAAPAALQTHAGRTPCTHLGSTFGRSTRLSEWAPNVSKRSLRSVAALARLPRGVALPHRTSANLDEVRPPIERRAPRVWSDFAQRHQSCHITTRLRITPSTIVDGTGLTKIASSAKRGVRIYPPNCKQCDGKGRVKVGDLTKGN